MKRAMAFLLFVLLALGAGVLPAAAESGTYGVDRALYGDVNLDQAIDASDALAILKTAVGKTALNVLQAAVADVNRADGINAIDALLVLQFAVKKISALPAGVTYEIQPESSDPVVRFDKTNSFNGAYEDDPTADTSFHANISSLPDHTLYRIGLSALPDPDRARLFYSLQGLINRDFGRDEDHTVLVYVLAETADTEWYNYMTEEGTIAADLMTVNIRKWDDLFAVFGDVIRACGLIAWDGNVPATANVAATICGLDGYLPVLYDSPLHRELENSGVEVKQSLAGQFCDGQSGQLIGGTALESTGSAKNDAYLWAMEKYFSRCSSQYLAYVLDGAITLKGYEMYEDHPVALAGGSNQLPNHDYFIARRCFFFDLAVNDHEPACDDPAQQTGLAWWGQDRKTMTKLFQMRYDRAAGAFGQLIGFPPWWAKYTEHNQQGSMGATWVEWMLSELISCYNLAEDAEVASTANCSVCYKYVPRMDRYHNNRPAKTAYDENKYYYTLYLGDYDSAAWMKTYVYSMWIRNGGDKRRGKLPLMWAFNPNLADRIPPVFDYVYSHKTDLDYFTAGDSGAGYVVPSGLVTGETLPLIGQPRPTQNADATQTWAAYCKRWYERFDMEITGFIINSSVYRVTPAVAACYRRFSPVGNLTNCSQTLLGVCEGTPLVYCQNGVNESTDPSVMYNHMFTRMAPYHFAAYRTVLRTPTQIMQITERFNQYAAEHGQTVEYCDPYTFFDLVVQSGQRSQEL